MCRPNQNNYFIRKFQQGLITYYMQSKEQSEFPTWSIKWQSL
jgi:hypothetical protein